MAEYSREFCSSCKNYTVHEEGKCMRHDDGEERFVEALHEKLMEMMNDSEDKDFRYQAGRRIAVTEIAQWITSYQIQALKITRKMVG